MPSAISFPDRVSSVRARIRAALEDADRLLRGEGRHRAAGGAVPVGGLMAMLGLAGFVYGTVLGSFGARGLQALFTGIKVPLLLIVSTGICVPSFYVLISLLGLRADFTACLRGILSAQAALALVLVCMAPLTLLVYQSGCSYLFAILFNGALFAIAALAGQIVLGRHWQPLIARAPPHRFSRWAWAGLYVFVAVQMAWVLRPFVGSEELSTTFFRRDAWDNAYVRLAVILWRWLSGLVG